MLWQRRHSPRTTQSTWFIIQISIWYVQVKHIQEDQHTNAFHIKKKAFLVLVPQRVNLSSFLCSFHILEISIYLFTVWSSRPYKPYIFCEIKTMQYTQKTYTEVKGTLFNHTLTNWVSHSCKLFRFISVWIVCVSLLLFWLSIISFFILIGVVFLSENMRHVPRPYRCYLDLLTYQFYFHL